MPYRVPTALELNETERAELEAWARRRKTAQALALRARIVLHAAAGRSNTVEVSTRSDGRPDLVGGDQADATARA
jgi:hypothetical protein